MLAFQIRVRCGEKAIRNIMALIAGGAIFW